MESHRTEPKPKRYALLSHESAVEAIWALAARGWKDVLDNENIWLVPDAQCCVRSQGDLKRLMAEVDLEALGIRRRPVDLLVPNNSCYSRGARARFHVWSDFFPPHSFVRVHDRVLVSTPYFAALQLAMARKPNKLSRKRAKESAKTDALMRESLGIQGPPSTAEELLSWENIARMARATQVMCDFMGTYRYVPASPGDESDRPDMVFNTKPIVRPDALESYLDEMGSVWGVRRARRVAKLAFAGAASPMETAIALMLSMPTGMGGFGLPRPRLNWEVPLDGSLGSLMSQDRIVADLSWEREKVAIEYYGWDEHFAQGPRKVAADLARANSLASQGWRVLHASFEQVRTPAGMALLARQVASALGTTLPQPTELELIWRSRLLTLLLPSTRVAL